MCLKSDHFNVQVWDTNNEHYTVTGCGFSLYQVKDLTILRGMLVPDWVGKERKWVRIGRKKKTFMCRKGKNVWGGREEIYKQ